jgi:hypothetical protein
MTGREEGVSQIEEALWRFPERHVASVRYYCETRSGQEAAQFVSN